jgi:PPOX class probable F420-dependent enzyme
MTERTGKQIHIRQEPASREIITSAHFSERARELLREPHIGTLALQTPGGIVQTEMWYALNDDDTLLLNTTTFRRKYEHVKKNPAVSLLVSRGNYQYVTMNGIVVLNDDPEIAQRDIRRLAIRYLGEEEADKIMKEEFSHEDRASMILTPTRITEYFSQ